MLYIGDGNKYYVSREEWFNSYFFTNKGIIQMDKYARSGLVNGLLYRCCFYYHLSEMEKEVTDEQLTENMLISFASIGFFWEEKVLLKVRNKDFLIKNIKHIQNFLIDLLFGKEKTYVKHPLIFISKMLEAQKENKEFMQEIEFIIAIRN